MPFDPRPSHQRARSALAARQSARRARFRRRRFCARVAACAILAVIVTSAIFLAHSYASCARLIDERLATGYLVSRAGIYAAPRVLRAGQRLSRDELVGLLRASGYTERSGSNVWSGSFGASRDMVEIRPQRPLPGSSSRTVRVVFEGGGGADHIAALTGDDGSALESYALDPRLLATDSMKSGNREILGYRDLPQVLIHAILSIEDRRFFSHEGVDPFGIVRALLRNTGDERIGQGGSTITQQLVKNTYLSPERTFARKFAEAMLAFTLERRLSKEDILALYCNEIYLGQRGALGVRGVGQAAHAYFGKDVCDLTLAEAATIAGMIQSPTRYSPLRHPESAVERRNTVLGAMARDGHISLAEAHEASLEPVTLASLPGEVDGIAPYFIDYVDRVIDAKLTAGAGGDERDLRVVTTIDLDLQRLAEGAISRQLEHLSRAYPGREAPQAAMVALDPHTGAVLAMVGGRSYAQSQLNRATDALRQPGSVFKPFVYAAALESGLSPLALYEDAPRDFTYGRKAVYRPSNYGDAYSMRAVTMREGLIHSLNVVTVDVAMQTGLARVADLAERCGLPKPPQYPALALGTGEATPLEVAAAYSVFANNGYRVEPHVIAGATGAGLLNESANSTQVLDPVAAFEITDMLRGVVDHGTARAARWLMKTSAVAGKTGTSRDGWFAGYTPNLVCVVWIGFDDNRQLGLAGAESALPVWAEFVKGALDLRPELGGDAFDRPEGIAMVDVDPQTGLRATPSCPRRERIALRNAFLPVECHEHIGGATLGMPAVAAHAEPPAAQDRALAASTAMASARLTAPAPLRTMRGQERAGRRPTRVDIDARGEPALVSDFATYAGGR